MHKTLLAAILFYCCCCSKPQQAIPVYGMYLDAAAQVIKVTDYGAKADDDQSDSLAFSQAMLQAHLLHRPLYLPEGRFNAIIKIPYDSIEIIGARKPGIDRNNAFTRGTVIEGWINASGHSAIKVTGLGIDCRKFSGYDAALNSGETNTWKALNQVFSHLTIYGGGYRQYTHGILCQAGSGITIADIDVYNFYHGIAIRHSDVTVTDVRSYRCGFTSVIVKSALGNEITRNVQVSHISS